jgi:hypothetical protein
MIHAEVAELVDALGSGSSGGFSVGVRVSPSALFPILSSYLSDVKLKVTFGLIRPKFFR